MRISIREIADRVGAPYSGGDRMITAVSSDSRHVLPGSLFIAIKGEKFDGHAFAAQALEKGAAFAVVMDEVDAPREKLLQVKDTRIAMMRIANLYRKSLHIKVVGVTGSVGKTTTKEMVACVCQGAFKTLKTEENLNNEFGLSAMIFRLEEDHAAAVLEMGMDGAGQIRELTRTAEPDIGIITNIGVSHMEALGSRENIRDAKLELVEGIPQGGTLLLPADDDMLCDYSNPDLNLLFFGIDSSRCDIRGVELEEYSTHTAFKVQYNGRQFDAWIPCVGQHNVRNALAAFGAGIALGMEPAAALASLREYRPAGMRQKTVEHNGYTVVEDCYNASPDSMLAAFQALGRLPCSGKRIAVISDMLELGPVAESGHRQIGEAAAREGVEVLLSTGELSALAAESAKKAGLAETHHFPDKKALFQHLQGIVEKGDVVWFKASRGMELEQVIQMLYGAG